MPSWKIIEQKYLEKNNWIALRKDSCETSTGKNVDDYYVLEMQDVSCVVAITKNKTMLFVKEYKHGVQKEILQLPCGYCEGAKYSNKEKHLHNPAEAIQMFDNKSPQLYVDQHNGKSEEPLAAAKRELEEETGYTAKEWSFLGSFAGSPGRLTHYYHFFLAKDCEKTHDQHLDDVETVKVLEYTKEQAEEELKKQATDIVTPLGFLMAKERWN